MEAWIKICGMTSAAAVEAALRSGVDAIGFVFAASSRQLAPADAARLAQPARGFATCVAVTRHPSQSEVDRILAEFGPDLLQTDWEDFERLKLPDSLPRLPVLRGGGAGAGEPRANGLPARVLFEGPGSGTGQVSDWQQARALARQTRLILAGGLNAGNVAAGIAEVRPFGVDTSSGVETRPGVKDPIKISNFVRAARAAFDGIPA